MAGEERREEERRKQRGGENRAEQRSTEENKVEQSRAEASRCIKADQGRTKGKTIGQERTERNMTELRGS